jgi:DNA-directed RNA polymerase subunit RPC12/RpoP
MEIANLDDGILISLMRDLQAAYDISIVAEKYGISIPQWLTIKYRCVACAKETRSRIQVINIRQANRELTCPFCRKISKMFTIHTEKEVSKLTAQDFM